MPTVQSPRKPVHLHRKIHNILCVILPLRTNSYTPCPRLCWSAVLRRRSRNDCSSFPSTAVPIYCTTRPETARYFLAEEIHHCTLYTIVSAHICHYCKHALPVSTTELATLNHSGTRMVDIIMYQCGRTLSPPTKPHEKTNNYFVYVGGIAILDYRNIRFPGSV